MKMKYFLIRSALVLTLASFLGCDSHPTGPAAATQTTSYQAVGVVKGLDPKELIIELDHENIPGLMPAMQMQFHVKERSLFDGLVVGDRIKFTVENGVGGLKITAIQKQ